MHVNIKIPDNWTKADVARFLRSLSPDAPAETGSKRNCFNCTHWDQTGERRFEGHCTMYSAECLAAESEGKPPPWWLPRKGETFE